MKNKEQPILISEEKLKILEENYCIIKFESEAELLETFLRDFLNYNEEDNLIQLVKKIVLDKKDYMRELLERDDIFKFNVNNQELYVHCSEVDLNEIILDEMNDNQKMKFI